ncbi:MAG: RNA polymerase subunit sigma-70, partial [Bacteroidaceae bacterium]|nr:RNA polymerase subunit sigma-70 [Bacteroidaceae bacterium]
MIDFNKDVIPLSNKFYRLALRMVHNDAEAQDITQETLIRLWLRRASLETAADAEALGLTVCLNLAKDALSRAGRNYEQIDNMDENF